MINEIYINQKKNYSPPGFLAELVSSKYKDEPLKIHSYIVKINFGNKRAEHYHEKKKEWIIPAFSKVLLKFKNIKTGEKKKYLLNFEDRTQKIVFIPPF